jgi:uncharacterized protein YdhG (YjbR/CyaY superfamily)
MAITKFKTVKDYIASKPRDVQALLKQLQGAIRKAVPDAEEVISYQMPGYKLRGGYLLFFAVWKEHFSLYPASDVLVENFKDELSRYKRSKGTIRLPLSEPVPVSLIERIAKFRAKHIMAVEKGRGRGKGRDAQLARVRRICERMPSVSEKLSHGAPTFFVQKDKGVFTVFANNHHEDGHLAVWLPAPPGLQAALIEDAPETYFKPPYVGAGGWIGIELDQIRDDALEIHILKAWELAAGDKKKARTKPPLLS